MTVAGQHRGGQVLPKQNDRGCIEAWHQAASWAEGLPASQILAARLAVYLAAASSTPAGIAEKDSESNLGCHEEIHAACKDETATKAPPQGTHACPSCADNSIHDAGRKATCGKSTEDLSFSVSGSGYVFQMRCRSWTRCACLLTT